MAIKRLKPIQDTFLSPSNSPASFGADEILELGVSPRLDSDGSSRILLEFMVNEVATLLGRHSLISATVHLKYALGQNLPSVYGIQCTEIDSEWTEGEGHIWDIPGYTDGASWHYPKGPDMEDRWEGGLKPDSEYTYKSKYFTGYQKIRDLSFDVTEWVYSWIVNPESKGLGFLFKFDNEELIEKRKARLCFYSSETHTVNSPYLELVYDDSSVVTEESECECGCKCSCVPTVDPNNLSLGVRNLKESYYIGDKVRIDLTVRPEYPVRQFATASIYHTRPEYLANTTWGIRDEYTGEMWVPFNSNGTKISYDDRGNYFILDTDLLEPERYYRLLFEVDPGHGVRKIYDSKNIFRVTRNGEL